MSEEERNYGFLLVGSAAAIWGTDALFRRGLTLEGPASVVVFGEHLLLVAMTFPLLCGALRRVSKMTVGDWVAVVLVGVGASAIATILFTHAFSYQDPMTPLLLQKLQPLLAVAGAALLLRERLLPHFAIYLVAALVGAYLITFPDPTAVSLTFAVPALFAVGAAILWAMGTVLGRKLSQKIAFTELAALRFAVGLPATALILIMQGNVAELRATGRSEWVGLFLLALVPGLISLLLYYRGLRETPAAAATLAELAFPLSAVLLSYFAFGAVLRATQWIGIAILSATITTMGVIGSRETRGLGVDLPRCTRRI